MKSIRTGPSLLYNNSVTGISLLYTVTELGALAILHISYIYQITRVSILIIPQTNTHTKKYLKLLL